MHAGDLLDASFLLQLFEANRGRLNLPDHQVSACQVVPLKVSKTGGKSVVECRLLLEPTTGGEAAPRSLVAIWRPDGENAATFDLMQRLWRWGFDGSGPDAVCEPVAYLDDCNLMVITKVEGRELEQVLAVDPRAAEASIEGAARWLARLHATPVRSGRTHTYVKERELLDRWIHDLDQVYPSFGPRLYPLGSALLDAERLVKRSRFRLIHGDFHPENIFVSEERVTVTDFERSCLFDPAQDLGFFLAQLAAKVKMGRYKVAAADLPDLRQRFLEAYQGETKAPVGPRVGLYEARSYLEVAHYIYCGLSVPPDPATFEFYLSSAEGCAREVA